MPIFLPDLNWMAKELFNGAGDAGGGALSHGVDFAPTDTMDKSPLWPMLGWTVPSGAKTVHYSMASGPPAGVRSAVSLVRGVETWVPSTAAWPLLLAYGDTGLPFDPDAVVEDPGGGPSNLLELTYAEAYLLNLLKKAKSGEQFATELAAVDSTSVGTFRGRSMLAMLDIEDGRLPADIPALPSGSKLCDILLHRRLCDHVVEAMRLSGLLPAGVPPNVSTGKFNIAVVFPGPGGVHRTSGGALRERSKVSVFHGMSKIPESAYTVVSDVDVDAGSPSIVYGGELSPLKIMWSSDDGSMS